MNDVQCGNMIGNRQCRFGFTMKEFYMLNRGRKHVAREWLGIFEQYESLCLTLNDSIWNYFTQQGINRCTFEIVLMTRLKSTPNMVVTGTQFKTTATRTHS